MSSMPPLATCSVDVGRRADEAEFLSTPPGEPDRVLRLDLRHHQRGLEDRCGSRAVVVDAGPFGHGVEVRSGHDDVVRVRCPGSSAMTLTSVARLGSRTSDVCRRARLRECHAVGEARSHDRDGRLSNGASVADDQALASRVVALVEDDHGRGARPPVRSTALSANVHVSALDEGDVVPAGEVQPRSRLPRSRSCSHAGGTRLTSTAITAARRRRPSRFR